MLAGCERALAEVDLDAVHLGLMQAEPAGGARNPFLSLLVDDITATVATLTWPSPMAVSLRTTLAECSAFWKTRFSTVPTEPAVWAAA